MHRGRNFFSGSGCVGERQPLEPIQMEIRRTKLTFNHCRALEVVANCQLLRDANAAMRLDRALPHELG